MPVAGVDAYGHWSRDPEPRTDLDPVSMEYLDSIWARYRDQAATIQAARRADQSAA
jgi:hypothetical protein